MPLGHESTGPEDPGPRRLLGALVHRLLHPRPVVLETRRPVEVPVITETKRRWMRGDRLGAVRFAYEGSLADIQRAFGVRFPDDWTHQDILERGVTAEMAPIPDFLHRLLTVYEPVRYGGELPTEIPPPDDILRSIYAHPKMWGLYVEHVARPDLDPRLVEAGVIPVEGPSPAPTRGVP